MTDLTKEQLKARKKRNAFLALGIVLFMGLIFAITLVKIQEDVARDQKWESETSGWQSSDVAESGDGAPVAVTGEDE